MYTHQIATKLNDTMGAQVRDWFEVIASLPVSTRVEHHSGGWFFTCVVTFNRDLFLDDIDAMRKFVNKVISNENDFIDDVTIDGKRYIMGDGDDSLSCAMSGGQLRIWVRHLD